MADIRTRGDRQRPHRRRAQARAARRTCAAAAWPSRTSAPTARTRSTTRTSPPRWRGRWRAARPTPASSSTAPASGRRSPPTRSRRARGDVHDETLARYAREHNGANVLALGATLVTRRRGARHRRHVPGDAHDASRATSAGWPRCSGWSARSEHVARQDHASDRLSTADRARSPRSWRPAGGAAAGPRAPATGCHLRVLPRPAARRDRRRARPASACTPPAARGRRRRG